jgi:hypothetical protein
MRGHGVEVAGDQARLVPFDLAGRGGHADAFEDRLAHGGVAPGGLVGQLGQVADGAVAVDLAAVG